MNSLEKNMYLLREWIKQLRELHKLLVKFNALLEKKKNVKR